MNSKWTGAVEDAFFDGEKFDRNRIIQKPELSYSGRTSAGSYYILAVDVGRQGCQTVIMPIKVKPQPNGGSIKQVVNIYTLESTHFEDQAIKIKQLYYQYNAKRIVIDGNGLGLGLLDDMVKRQVIEGTEETYVPFGVYGGTYEGAAQEYKQFRTNDTEDDAIYIMKANAPINSEAYSIVQAQMNAGKIKFLLDYRAAKAKLMSTKLGKEMKPEARETYLLPYSLTDILREEMLNLREETDKGNIRLKPANSRIKHDKFSALAYGIYYIREVEDNRRRNRSRDFSKFMFIN